MRSVPISALVLLLAACGGSSGPIVLATGEQQPSALVAHGGTLYWIAQATETNAASVRKASAQGGAASTLAEVAGPRSLALSSSAAIVGTTGGNVYQALLADGTLTVLIPKNGADAAIAVAVQGDFAYVAYNSGRLVRVSISVGAVSLIELGFAASKVDALLADATNLYWLTSAGDVYFEAGDGSTGVMKLGSLDATATAAALFDGSLYFLETNSVAALSISTAAFSVALQGGNNCAPPRVCSDTLWGLASNDSGVYAGLTHGIGQIDLAAGSATLVASVNSIGTTLAADSSNVYWSAPSVDANGQATGTSTIYRAGL